MLRTPNTNYLDIVDQVEDRLSTIEENLGIILKIIIERVMNSDLKRHLPVGFKLLDETQKEYDRLEREYLDPK